jgi:hypothetical protein
LITAAQRQRWLEFDAWFTPGDVAEQVLRGVDQLGIRPASVLDVGAGAGIWLQRAAFVWPDAERIGVEIRPEEEPHLRRWCHEVRIGDFRRVSVPRVDLIVGNFAFKALCPKIQWSLRRARWIVTLVPAGFGASEGAEQLLQHRPPGDALRLAGRIAFFEGATDFQHHEALIWDTEAQPTSWTTHPLPLLPPASRRWIVRPGEESHPRPLAPIFYPRLPSSIGSRPLAHRPDHLALVGGAHG